MLDTTKHDILNSVNWKKFALAIFVIGSLWAIILTFSNGIFNITEGREVPWLHIFINNYNSFFVWMLLTPVLFYFSIQVYFTTTKWYLNAIAHLLFAVLIITPLHSFLFISIDWFVQSRLHLLTINEGYQDYLSEYFLVYTVYGLLTYGIIIGFLSGFVLYIRNRKISKQKLDLQSRLMQSRIINLKYQLQPHFLFNSMQTISNLMHLNVNDADEAIANLSDILRFSINQLNTDLIEISKEVEIIEKYISLQKLRFKGKIEHSFSIQSDLKSRQIPALLLQPLVENSIKHGFETDGSSLKIIIEIFSHNNTISLVVQDNGPGYEQGFENKSNITGIKNLKDRLQYFYANDFKFITENTPIGTKTEIRLPKQTNND